MAETQKPGVNPTKPIRRPQHWHWVNTLKQLGFNTFKISQIPAHLRSISMLRKASADGLIRRIDRDELRKKVWTISSEVK